MKEVTMTERDIHEIERILGYTFRNPVLLRQAFTRRSYTNEMKQRRTPSDTEPNEVLEFIGDSVLSAALVTIFSRSFASLGPRGLESRFSEGELTEMKKKLCDKNALSSITTELNLARFMRVSTGDANNGIPNGDSPKEDLFESIIAAVALDCGMDFSVIVPLVERLDRPARLTESHPSEKDPKTRLKEFCEKSGRKIEYLLNRVEGPDDAPQYTVSCEIDGKLISTGMGGSKKRAEKQAAERAIPLVGA